MNPLQRLGRKWRSVSFRSGLLSALSVGIVASLAILLVTVLVFVIFALTGAVAETNLIDRAEDQLLLGVDPADLNLESTLDDFDRPRAEGTEAFWMVSASGSILNSNGDVRQDVIEADFITSDFDLELEQQRAGDQFGIKAVGDEEWFYFERQVAVPDGPSYRVITAYDGTFSLWRFIRAAFPVTIPIVLVLMGVAMLVTSWLTRRALRRVEHMRAEVEQITQESLNRRVPVVNASDGIEKLGHTMNDMLARLEDSSAQQSQFLADASHELRSPVAGLLAQLDVATLYPDRVDTNVLLPKLRDEAQRLQALVDDLMFLSRAESPAARAAASTAPDRGFAEVDIDSLVAGEAAHQKNIDDTVNVHLSEPSGARVHGNPRDLERALRNLVGNAVRHCNEHVHIRVRTTTDSVVIVVADDGPGIAIEDQERIFQRFVRLDEARTRDAGGSGLGLAIALEIATRHGGAITLVDTGQPGATFELTLPRNPSKGPCIQ